MSCWIKTSGTPSGTYTNIGARIGFDYYGTLNGQWARICGIGSPYEAGLGEGYPNIDSWQNEAPNVVVDWGSAWTLITWNFTVPNQAMGDSAPGTAQGLSSANQVPLGQWNTIVGFDPWLQVYGGNGYNNMQTSWFSDFQVYINP